MLLFGTALRPNEAYGLRWENVTLANGRGLIRITEGKTKAARRVLPLMPDLYAMLQARWDAQGQPTAGYVFPRKSGCGHISRQAGMHHHVAALKRSRVTRFEVYTLRHNALTRLAESGCDAFTLARIAGHSSITVTKRYCHPQAEAIETGLSPGWAKMGLPLGVTNFVRIRPKPLNMQVP